MKKEKNIIHRYTTRLLIKLKKETSQHKAGAIIQLYKNGFNQWIGGGGFWFLSHLRNNNYIEILKQE